MVRKNPNKSFYHYKMDLHDRMGEVIQTTYYMTLYEIMGIFDCSRKAVQDKLRTPDSNSRKFKNMKIYRVNEPVFLRVENPRCKLDVDVHET